MQRYNQRMVEQLKVRQQQEKARLPKIQRSEGKTRMAMYKKSLHISGAGSAAEQREKIKQVGSLVHWSGRRPGFGGACTSPGWGTYNIRGSRGTWKEVFKPQPGSLLNLTTTPLWWAEDAWCHSVMLRSLPLWSRYPAASSVVKPSHSPGPYLHVSREAQGLELLL